MLSLEKLQLDFKSKIIDHKIYPHINLNSLKLSGEINEIAISRGINQAEIGNSLISIDKIIESTIRDRNAIPAFINYHNYKHASCLSVNDVAVHGVPNEYKLQDGDVLKIDVGTIYDGWYTDAARTVIIGDPKYKDHIKLINNTSELLNQCINILRANISLLDIANIIEKIANDFGVNLIGELGGHYINPELHVSPFISNVVPKDKKEKLALKNHLLKVGDIICIEPVTTLGYPQIYVDPIDGWSCRTLDKSVTAHFEATFLICENHCEVISW